MPSNSGKPYRGIKHRPNGQFAKGTGGRPPGSTNKYNQLLRGVSMEVFEEIGGKRVLKKLAKEDPKWFLEFLLRQMPKEVKADVGLSLAQLIVQSNDLEQGGEVIDVEAKERAR